MSPPNFNRIAERNAKLITVEDRPVQNGDTVNIDYEGSVDGVPFEGGAAKGQNLVIGSNTFIPGFEEQLIGFELNEEKDIQVKFPDEYHSKDLAGKDATIQGEDQRDQG
jgi:trigger factor